MEEIKSESFGKLKDGREIVVYTLKNAKNNVVKIINYGARVISWKYNSVEVVLGYNNIASYENDSAYLGAIVGRCANRIGGACFSLNGKSYNLDKNDREINHLHGGFSALESKVWEGEILCNTLKLTTTSPAGEGGYPANLKVEVKYRLSNDDGLEIEYLATADDDTICNLTNHTYFNLNGSGNILDHKIQIFADNYTWADENSIPDGRILSVENTPMDLRNLTRIADHIDDDFEELNFAGGYDHNWCIKGYDKNLKKAAFLLGDKSGIKLNVYTTLCGIQFYAGNFLNDDFGRRGGLALEAQFFPNAINIPHFEQPILKKGEKWKAKTIYVLNK